MYEYRWFLAWRMSGFLEFLDGHNIESVSFSFQHVSVEGSIKFLHISLQTPDE